ncbi:carboxypeptidase-like regulatory domain-containing protein [Granulicella sp. 5B5]|uniref:carboxypeptidase-like regulatory domain-containing protein n=1 Tax=Granulicella sp. 5B5 TaxID=1617967 RepID=UPI0015F71E7A|nr:carboxypeptidase-like regulatory domain-containing protein [Granulicella sp. 5B5]
MPQAVPKLALFAALLCAPALFAQIGVNPRTRELSGTVTDHQHEPLRGAVVKLQEGDTPNIVSYITGQDGRYRFRRLNGNTDYRVWVTFRERTSKSKSISKFDEQMNKVIDFTMETF